MSKPVSPLEREILSGNPVVTMTSGDSMEPLLFDHDTRVVIRRAEGTLKKGDLPVYRRPSGQFVMHRVERVGKDCYDTRGTTVMARNGSLRSGYWVWSPKSTGRSATSL